MGFEIHVYLISAGPTQLPVFNCTLRILLRVPRVNSQFHSAQLPVIPQASLASPFWRTVRAPLPLPLGEVAERSEVGEGKQKIQLRTPFPVFYEPCFMNIFPALGKTVSYKALPRYAALP